MESCPFCSIIYLLKMVTFHNHVKIPGRSTTHEIPKYTFHVLMDAGGQNMGKNMVNSNTFPIFSHIYPYFPMRSTFFPMVFETATPRFENRATPTAASTSETGSRSMAPSVQEQLSMVSRSGLWIFTWKCSKKMRIPGDTLQET